MPSSSPTGLLAPFGVVGMSHKTAALELRSSLGVPKDELPNFLAKAKAAGIEECILLSTCNRTELYFSGSDGKVVAKLLADHVGVPVAVLRPHLYEKPCVCAACHLFRVTAGLDSAVLGETEIVAQVKEAWAIAGEAGMVGPMLDLLFKRAMEASKRLRRETELCRHVTSTASLAVRQAKEALGDLTGKNLLILGAGKIARRLAKELSEVEGAHFTVANRTIQRAEEVAESLAGTACSLSDLDTKLAEADAVFAAVGAGRSVIARRVLEGAMANRPERPMVILDLGVPPNVERGAEVPGVLVVDLDELSGATATNAEVRNSSVQPALFLLDEELGRFGEALVERAASPTIKALMKMGDTVRQRNVAWAKERLPDLGEREMRVIDELAKRMVIGLLESPVHTLKTDISVAERREMIEHLFSLNEEA